jgi:uncharacterized protein YjbJ (UPF0337 family)
MNKDELKGKMKDAAGRAEREVGKATGDKKTEAHGMLRQAEGKVQKAVGKVKNAVRAGRKKAA